MRLQSLDQSPPELLAPVLAAEAHEWRTLLHWNRTPVNHTALDLAARRRLPGWLLLDGDRPVGKVLVGRRLGCRSLEFPYVVPQLRSGNTLAHLVAGAVRVLQGEARVERVEVGVFPFGAPLDQSALAPLGLQSLPRQYMTREPAAGDVPAPVQSRPLWEGASVVPWWDDRSLPAVLAEAYLASPDRDAVDLYATRRGCILYLEALRRSPACGTFEPALSGIAVDRRGRPIGFLLATRISDGTAHVAQVAIHPDWQGHGLGDALLRRHLAAASAQDTASSLLVTRDNEVALKWYRRRGYRDGAPFLCYWWERPDRPAR